MKTKNKVSLFSIMIFMLVIALNSNFINVVNAQHPKGSSSGKIKLNTDPNVANLFCHDISNPNSCRDFTAKSYRFDEFSNSHDPYLMFNPPDGTDSYYTLEVPFDTASYYGFSGKNVFTPGSIETEVTSPKNGKKRTAGVSGISGNIKLTIASNSQNPFCHDTNDPNSCVDFMIEAYRFDVYSNSYDSYAAFYSPVASDGSYILKVPFGKYRVTALYYGWNGNYIFAPDSLEGVVVSPENGLVTGNDFSAGASGISGNIKLTTDLNMPNPFCYDIGDPNSCWDFLVEAYRFDKYSNSYDEYPMFYSPVASDGSYTLDVPFGTYKVIANYYGWNGNYKFTPGKIEGIVISPENGIVGGVDFIAGTPVLPETYYVVDFYNSLQAQAVFDSELSASLSVNIDTSDLSNQFLAYNYRYLPDQSKNWDFKTDTIGNVEIISPEQAIITGTGSVRKFLPNLYESAYRFRVIINVSVLSDNNNAYDSAEVTLFDSNGVNIHQIQINGSGGGSITECSPGNSEWECNLYR